MKKNLFFGLCAASMLLMTSCDKEAFGGRFGEQETNVTLSVSLPELQTRAYGTGLNAKYLQYAVYSLDAQGALNEQIEKTNLVLTKLAQNDLSIKLVPGTKYAIVLWADAYGDQNSPFTVTMEKNQSGEFVNTLTVNNTAIKTSDDNADAFFGSYEINVTGVNQYTITDALNNDAEIGTDLELKRPFAQLNISSTIADYNTLINSGFALAKTTVEIQNAYSSMDLRTGDMLGGNNGVAVKYALNDLPTLQSEETANHKLLTMNYILMSADKFTANKVIFTYSDGTEEGTKTKEYSYVPLRRNWRTNIYGELFTNDVKIFVSIAPNFANQTTEDEDGNGTANDEQYSGNNGDFSAYDTTNP